MWEVTDWVSFSAFSQKRMNTCFRLERVHIFVYLLIDPISFRKYSKEFAWI